jgi:hypothetical protein
MVVTPWSSFVVQIDLLLVPNVYKSRGRGFYRALLHSRAAARGTGSSPVQFVAEPVNARDSLTLWKDADPDIPILQQAKAKYAKLK